MIILDQDKLSQFLESIARGFEPSPLEILLVILFVLSFMAFLLLIYRWQRSAVNRKQRRRFRQQYEQLAKQRDLNPTEQDLIERLSRFLRAPEKKYLLLANQATFNNCVAKLRAKEALPAIALSGLRLKLGFTLQNPERVPASSAELPEKLPVMLRLKDGRKFKGRIVGGDPQSLVVAPRGQAPLLRSGTLLTLYFQNRSGVFAFSTHVQSAEDETLRLDHSDRIERYQRRAYYRKRVMLPVFIKPAGSEEPPLASIMMDLGGGGASVKNPEERFGPGTDLELSFSPEGEDRLFVLAEVLRISGGGKTLHLRFGSLKEPIRDRIIGFLFRGRR